MKKLLASIFFILFGLSIGAVAQTRGWGTGALGTGDTTPQPNPVTISGLDDVTGIGAGGLQTLFLKANGTLLAAGSNDFGQLGTGSTGGNQPMPIPVSGGLTNVIQVTGSRFHSAALLSNGEVWSWGYNEHGVIGNGTTTTSGCICIPTPTQSAVSGIIQIDAGFYHTLALKSDGTVWTWGWNNNGQLGEPTGATTRPTPFQIPGLSGIIAISAGTYSSLALKSDGTVYGWGSNAYGQVGNNGGPAIQSTPVRNTMLSNVVQIAAGTLHSLALLNDGTVRVWGYNFEGQMGNGTTTTTGCACQITPVSPTGISNAIEIKTSAGTTSVRLSDGSVRSWGSNFNGQVGDGTTTISGCQCKPTPVTTLVGANNTGIAIGGGSGFALKPVIAAATGANQTFQGDSLRLTFANITGAGNVGYTAIDPATVAGSYTVPPGYVIQNDQPAYDVTTSATTSGDIYVCIKNINEFNSTNFLVLKILHGEGTNWVDRTFSSSFITRQICARVTSLSPFVIAQSLVPTAATVSISGRVIFGKGNLTSRASVSLTDSRGAVRSVLVNPFGFYRFDDVSVGETCIIQVAAKGATFVPRVITPTDDIGDLNFMAQ